MCIENVTLIWDNLRGLKVSSYRKFGHLLSETQLIPLEFLIKDRAPW